MTFTHRRASALIAALVGNLTKTFSIPGRVPRSPPNPISSTCSCAAQPSTFDGEKLFTGGLLPNHAEQNPSAHALTDAAPRQRLDCLAGPRLKIRPITPALPPCIVGIAYRKEGNSAAKENFIAAAKRAKSG